MSLFGTGLSAAVALRARILERLGTEDEWIHSSEELSLVPWMSGPVATFFRVGDGAGGTPDLGILRIVTPVATIRDPEAAQQECDRRNRAATTSRWTINDDGLGVEVLAATCAFVVGTVMVRRRGVRATGGNLGRPCSSSPPGVWLPP